MVEAFQWHMILKRMLLKRHAIQAVHEFPMVILKLFVFAIKLSVSEHMLLGKIVTSHLWQHTARFDSAVPSVSPPAA